MGKPKQHNMYDSQVRTILKNYSYLSNDVAGIEYPKGKKVEGFSHRSRYTCDNIVLWMLCHDTPQKKGTTDRHGTTTAFAIITAREILRKYMGIPNLKFIGRGKDKGPDLYRKVCHEKRRKFQGMGTNYIPGYIAIKVSLSDVELLDAHQILSQSMDELERSHIILHDIDVFVDCGGITNREIVQEYLLANDVSIQSIVNDRRNVGDDCISWMVNGKRRNKVYNKYIQMLQSCDVRKAVGSIIADLVYNPDPKFTDKLLKYNKIGMSRVETTFYSSILQSVDYYTNRMDNLLDFLGGCPVYHVSFKKQWQRLVRQITSTFAVYVANEEIFVYSHWWNSITEKTQGYSKLKVKKGAIDNLLANYSFNDRPMYFIRGDLLDDGSFKVSKERTYRREEGSTAITLVPGSNRGLYPSLEVLDGVPLSFDDVGLVSYKNITIGWPTKRLRKTTKALAKISYKKGIPTREEMDNPIEEPEKDTGNVLKEINISIHGRFQSAHTLAKDGPKEYTIVGYGMRMYYGEMVTFLLALDGTKIRCTKTLQGIVNPEITKGIPFQIRLLKDKVVNKYNDVVCEIIN